MIGRPARLEQAIELLDSSDNERDLEHSLRHLARVNRWLGGTRAVGHALDELIPRRGSATLLDVGCGDGEFALQLAQRAAARGTTMTIVATDRNATTTTLARRRTRGSSFVRIVRSDALALPFRDRAVDIVLMSLTLHHFEGVAASAVVQEMARVARRAVVVHDLERSWLHYIGAKLLAATAWRGSCLCRHDGPVSVLRAFTPAELAGRVNAPGLAPARVMRRFFYRLVAVADRVKQEEGQGLGQL
jgi:SAM-dependent methyltransferase